MQARIFRGYLLLTVLLFLALAAALVSGLYGLQTAQVRDSLRGEAALIASALERDGGDAAATLGTLATDRRVTLVAADGAVRYDNAASLAALGDHSGREEIRRALADGEATVTRRSDTLAEEMVYHARRLSSGDVLRLAAAQRSLWGHLLGYLPGLMMLMLLCALSAALLSRAATKRLMRPIERIDLAHPLENDCYEELTPLLGRIHEQQRQNEQQLQSLRAQKSEQDALFSRMREGLVMLGQDGQALAMNDAAASILGLHGTDDVGRALLEVDRSQPLRELLARGRAEGAAYTGVTLGARHYHASASRVGEGEGLLLLLQDDTAEFDAQAMRREFTANVSHELRTPLTAISGYAEMLESGMVRAEDEKEFMARIRREASRMLSLVEDILRLSQLDEGSVPLESRSLDLRALAGDVLERLSDKAKGRGVTLALEGEATTLGDQTLAGEIVYNLADNAVKYNRPGGRVTLELYTRDERAVLTVTDTGIGIPLEQQTKVFERFYRVDKSRSKETGGTGLGLSIVRHAALLMDARVALSSVEGEGTTVTVTFPRP